MLDQILGDESNRVGKWVATTLLLLSVFLMVLIISGLKRLPSVGREVYPQSTVMVTGEGEAYAIPDIASFSFSVTEAGETVQSAQELLDKKINKALAAVKDTGVEDKDIKTQYYNVYPKYEWEQAYCIQIVGATCPPGKNVLIGYEVSQTILIKVRDTEKAADLVTKVGAIGVSNISGLEFTVDDREKYVNQAREQAIAKAREQAKVRAKQLGVRLGKLLYFNENGYGSPYYDMGISSREGMGGGAMPLKADLPVGETKITSSVSITYEIK